MKEIESIASALFDKIRSRFPNVTLGDEKAKATSDPSKARFFNFTYTSNIGDGDHTGIDEDKFDNISKKLDKISGKIKDIEPSAHEHPGFGTVTISLIDETSLKVYYSQDIAKDMDRDQRKEWYEFLRNLRQFAKRNLLTFDTRDINKSNLELQDIKQQAKVDDVADINDVTMMESRVNYHGTSKTSYATIGECTLIIKHTDTINDEVRGARTRHVNEIFIQTPRGERFLCDHRSINGAVAQATHINAGGNLRDQIGESINTMVQEMDAMRHFVRQAKHRQFEDVETNGMKEAAIKHFNHLKETLKSLKSTRNYNRYVENFVPAQSVEEDVDVIALKERFVKKIYDDRFDAALPIVFREYKRQQAKIDGMVLEFSDWVHDINEDVYEKPTKDNQHQLQYLQELLNGAIHGGFEGKDAIDKLSDCGIGDTELENDITKYAMDHGPDADVTPLVKTWLKQYVPDLYKDLEIGQNNGRNAQTNWEQPETPEMDNHTYADGKGGEGDAGWNMTY